MSAVVIVDDDCGVVISEEVRSLLHTVARRTLVAEQMPTDVEVGLTFVDDESIAQLNDRYRGVNSATDVLSFPLFNRAEIERLRTEPEAFPERPLLLGDIVVAAPTAVRQAAEYGHDVRRELAFLFVHGLLHLLGYDHDDESSRQTMRRAEEAVLTAVGLRR